MAEKYVSVSELRKLLGIPADGKCSNCQFSTFHGCKDDSLREACEAIDDAPEADVRPVPPGGIGEMSDGYHTFNGLYYQRMVLFAELVKQNKDSAWKSHRHEDGELCFGGGWFIVGIDTPKGSYTYHYEDKDWDLFDCEELPVGKHWDGHTEDDVTRLLSLPEMRPVVRGKWEYEEQEVGGVNGGVGTICGYRCPICDILDVYETNFCPNCGARTEGGKRE